MIKFIKSLPNNKISAPILNQLVRSSTSIGANVIEAQAASSRKDFGRYYDIALKSANETKYWLGLVRDGLEIDKLLLEPLLKETNELSKILGASLITLRGKK